MAPNTTDQPPLALPMLVASPIDVGRLIRELESLNEAVSQAELRHHEAKMPRTSHMMDQTIELNKLNLLEAKDRQALQGFLTSIKEKAPVLHMSFSADPSPAFIEKLMSWLRREIHPLVLLTIGLQPNIGAGCVVRSTNKYFDMSLRQDFESKRGLLRESLAALSAPAKAEVTQ